MANYKIQDYLLSNTSGIFYFVVNFYLKSGEKLFFCQTIVFSGFCVKKVKQCIIWKIDARILFLAQFNKKYSKYLHFNDYPGQIINFEGTQKIIDYKF